MNRPQAARSERLRQRGEAGLRGRVVTVIHVAKEPRFAAGVDHAAVECGDQSPRASAVRPPSPAETAREMAMLRDSEVVEW